MCCNNFNVLLQYVIGPLMTSRLTQDALENLFSQVRGRGDSHPTPVKFRHNLRLISISQFTKTPKNSSYDSVDDTCYAVPLIRSKRYKADSSSICEQVPVVDDLHNAASVFNGVLSTCEKNALAYIAGWVAFKVKSKVSCETCVNWLLANEANEGNSAADLQLTLCKSYGGKEYGLTLPSQNLLIFMQNAERVFLSSKPFLFSNIDLQQFLLDKSSVFLCHSNIPKCHDLSGKILKKFFKLRLYAHCKEASKPTDDIQHGSKSAKSRTLVK